MRFFFLVVLMLIPLSLSAHSVHFFGSVTGAQSTIEDNDIEFDGIKNKPTFTEQLTAGLSVSTNLAEKMPALIQLIYRNDTYIAVDLLQVRHNFSDDFFIRVGKQRLPFNLHSENIQVQALLPWLFAPREIYSKQPIYSFTGAALEKNFGDYLNFHFYTGDTKDVFLVEQEYSVETKNLVGGRLNFTKDELKAFVNHYQADGELQISSDFPLTPVGLPPTVNGKFKQSYELSKIRGTTAGFEYRPGSYIFMSEYAVISSLSRSYSRVEAFYVSLGKEFAERWTPLLTFSTDLDVESELSPTKTSTYAFNLNYRLDLNNVIKFGYDHVNLKERSVTVAGIPTPVNSTVLANRTPSENFDIFSVMWAFVY